MHINRINRQLFFEVVRYGIVGILATVIHYGIYWILQHWVNINISYTIGYAISFICNLFLTSYFTFKKKVTFRRGIGFSNAHIVNYFLQMILLNVFIRCGMSKAWAPVPVYCIVIPINFLLVRYVFKTKNK
ncbi:MULTISPECIES: GtrA family protein [Prevotellaceae]|uniref:GtrA family protein n=1 Tax=Prevotellaceae TaxID=171552 RepID=UPI00050ECD58|nr:MULTISPECIES: GtrA family protein [Prevotellaceae]KGF40684.1 polysaccharide biosynthesis protein GtrA [Hoylesella buccalis DNF00985]